MVMNIKTRSVLYVVLLFAALLSVFFIRRIAGGELIFLILLTVVSLAVSFDKEYRAYKKIRMPVWCTLALIGMIWTLAAIDYFT